MPDLSILIPHKPGPSNDKAFELALNSIVDCTEKTYELIVDRTVPGNPYAIWNDMSDYAVGKTLIFTNSDVIFAPGWDVMADHAAPNVIVTGYIVEPGNIGVAPVNIAKDFGKHPDTYRESDFHSFARKHKAPDIKEERGWYMPCAMNAEWFRSTERFPTVRPFPHPSDIDFWEYCKNELETKFMRARSYSYHFQNQSGRE